MMTLTIIVAILYLYSIYRIRKDSVKHGYFFHPFENVSNEFTTLLFILGCASMMTAVIYLIIKYLP